MQERLFQEILRGAERVGRASSFTLTDYTQSITLG
jgi:hypothetical protein